MNLQVKVIAENDEALQQALKEVEVYFGQSVCYLNYALFKAYHYFFFYSTHSIAMLLQCS